MLPTKVVVIGAGSASFGLNTLVSLMRSARLRGSHLALVDLNKDTLALIAKLAERLNNDWDAQMTITTHTRHAEVLEGAEFVVISIEVSPREELWRMDYQIPLKYGVRQPYAENGGPGGFAHAARNIGPIMEIARQMERYCPGAWMINFSNPLLRLCDAVNRYSRVKVVGLCHQINVGYAIVGYLLADILDITVGGGFPNTAASPSFISARAGIANQAKKKIDIKAAGINHFTWVLSIHDKRTGEDLIPIFEERWVDFDPSFEPLTRRVYQHFGLFPVPGDEHLCEYLPWLSDPVTKPWEKLDITLYEWDLWESLRQERYKDIAKMGEGMMGTENLRNLESEGAGELIEALTGTGNHFHPAVNVPNEGNISNLPENAIVEVPGLLSAFGVRGIGVGELPEGIAELCRRELTTARLGVDAVIHGDRQLAMQCLLLDPVIRDMDVAKQILDDYLESYRNYLPQFWS